MPVILLALWQVLWYDPQKLRICWAPNLCYVIIKGDCDNCWVFEINWEISTFDRLGGKNDLLGLLCGIRVKTHFPLKCPVFDGLQVQIQPALAEMTWNRDLSSTNCLAPDIRLLPKSFMYTKKRKDPSADPWGTPALIILQSQDMPLNAVLW